MVPGSKMKTRLPHADAIAAQVSAIPSEIPKRVEGFNIHRHQLIDSLFKNVKT